MRFPDSIARPATTLQEHQVLLTRDHRMFGRLVGIDRETGRARMIQNVRVYVIANDRVLTHVPVNQQGFFTLSIAPGVYSLVAAGPDGFGASGFEAVTSLDQVSHDPADRVFQWAFFQRNRVVDDRVADDRAIDGGAELLPPAIPGVGGQGGNTFSMAVIDDPAAIRQALAAFGPAIIPPGPGGPTAPFAADAAAVPLPPPQVPATGYPSAGPSSSGAGAGGFAGGGGFRGAGGIGAVLGVAGLTTGVVSLIDAADNNDSRRNLVSPFVP